MDKGGGFMFDAWETMTKEKLSNLYYNEDLSDNEIAEIYEVSRSKVVYKRNKFGISYGEKVYRKFVEENKDLFKELNQSSKKRLLKQENIDAVSKAITHYAFRNGPVENMHGKGQLSEDDMYVLNKYMVDRIAGVLCTIANGEWAKLELLLAHYKIYGSGWDKPEPDMEEIEFALKWALEKM